MVATIVQMCACVRVIVTVRIAMEGWRCWNDQERMMGARALPEWLKANEFNSYKELRSVGIAMRYSGYIRQDMMHE